MGSEMLAVCFWYIQDNTCLGFVKYIKNISMWINIFFVDPALVGHDMNILYNMIEWNNNTIEY